MSARANMTIPSHGDHSAAARPEGLPRAMDLARIFGTRRAGLRARADGAGDHLDRRKYRLDLRAHHAPKPRAPFAPDLCGLIEQQTGDDLRRLAEISTH